MPCSHTCADVPPLPPSVLDARAAVELGSVETFSLSLRSVLSVASCPPAANPLRLYSCGHRVRVSQQGFQASHIFITQVKANCNRANTQSPEVSYHTSAASQRMFNYCAQHPLEGCMIAPRRSCLILYIRPEDTAQTWEEPPANRKLQC